MVELELFQMYHLKEMSLSAELFLSCCILQLTFFAVGTTYQRKHGFVILSQQTYDIGSLILGFACLLLINEDLLVSNSFSSNHFIINDYAGFATKLVICAVSVVFLIVIKVSHKDEPIQNNLEYVLLITAGVLGLLLLSSSNDLITAYLAIELHSLAFYLMAAFKKSSSYSVESGLKYFIIGSLSSALFLFGSSFIYGCVGSLNFDDLRMFSPFLHFSTELHEGFEKNSFWFYMNTDKLDLFCIITSKAFIASLCQPLLWYISAVPKINEFTTTSSNELVDLFLNKSNGQVILELKNYPSSVNFFAYNSLPLREKPIVFIL
jgi:hypothetical protein